MSLRILRDICDLDSVAGEERAPGYAAALRRLWEFPEG
jgi:hypothetical protein